MTAVSRVDISPLTIGAVTIDRIGVGHGVQRGQVRDAGGLQRLGRVVDALAGVRVGERARWRPRPLAGRRGGRRAAPRGSSRRWPVRPGGGSLDPADRQRPQRAVGTGVLHADVEDGGVGDGAGVAAQLLGPQPQVEHLPPGHRSHGSHARHPGHSPWCARSRGISVGQCAQDPGQLRRSAAGSRANSSAASALRAASISARTRRPSSVGRRITARRSPGSGVRSTRPRSCRPSATSVADRGAMCSASARSVSRTPSRRPTTRERARLVRARGPRARGRRASGGAACARPASAGRPGPPSRRRSSGES